MNAGGERRGERRVRQIGRDEALELGDQLMHALGREVEGEQFDGDEPVAHGIVRAEHGTQSAGTNLMKNTKRSEGVRWRSASSIVCSEGLLREGGFMVTRKMRNLRPDDRRLSAVTSIE